MDSNINYIKLYGDTFAYAGRGSNEENAEIFKNQLNEYITLIQKLADSNFDKLSDKELLDLLCEFYNIRLEEEDYLEMFSMLYGHEYYYATLIPTTMVFEDRAEEGHRRSFDYWNQKYQVYYYAAISEDYDIDAEPGKVFTREEIIDLANNHDIVLMREHIEPYDRDEFDSFEEDEYDSVKTNDITIESYSDNISDFALEHIDVLGKILRKKFTRKLVLKDAYYHVQNLVYDIRQVLARVDSDDKDYAQTARLCKEWYESSIEKQTVMELQRVLGENKN